MALQVGEKIPCYLKQHLMKVEGLRNDPLEVKNTVDGSEIPRSPPGMYKTHRKYWDKLPSSTGAGFPLSTVARPRPLRYLLIFLRVYEAQRLSAFLQGMLKISTRQKWLNGGRCFQKSLINLKISSLWILAHRTSDDELLGCIITSETKGIYRFHETILRRWARVPRVYYRPTSYLYTPRKLTWRCNIHHLKMYFLLKMVIFQCHVSFQCVYIYIHCI